MRTDSQLQADIISELRWDPQVESAEIGVAVNDSVATLTGTVASYSQKLAAEHAAKRVSGVQAVAESVTVKLPEFDRRTDIDIAQAAISGLRWSSAVPIENVTVKVENGLITLEGSVPYRFQSDAAEYAVRHLTGVKGIRNMICVKPPVSPAAVRSKIEDAFKRSSTLNSRRIAVDSLAGKITLNGTVHSWAEREDAENAAWAAPGVTCVDDKLVVA